MITKKGINASPGVAIGPAFVLDTEEYRIPRRSVPAAQVPEELRRLDAALAASREEVGELRTAAARKLGEKTSAIFAFHEHLIADPKIRSSTIELIEGQKFTAAYAYAQVMNQRRKAFLTVSDPYLKERARDFQDIEKRVLRHILGKAREDIARLTEPVIIVAHDITPSLAVSLDPKRVLGFAINVGGQTSHMAIISRMQGIPAVVALSDITGDVAGGETLIVDGTHGIVFIGPTPEMEERYQARRREYQRVETELRRLRDEPAITQDGTRIQLSANIEVPEDARIALDLGAEGIGLYRTELLFLSHGRLPSEEEQFATFKDAVEAAAGKPIVIRTIDLGADKLLPGVSIGHEHNPAVGLRSLRFCLKHLDMFKTHLRAILRASAFGDARIMFPMITTLMELRQAKSLLADTMEDLEEEGQEFRPDLPIGMMIETPAAAMMADVFAPEVAFMSLGTNDLTQYVLAVDRGNERVAHLYSPHNPAVLRLIAQVVQAGRTNSTAVSLCGEMASAPVYGQLLIGLGLRHLSMAPKDVLTIKKLVRMTTLERCEAVAQKALSFDEDRQVLSFLRDEMSALLGEDL